MLSNTGMQAQKQSSMPPMLTRINTSQLTWTCPERVHRPHNSAVFTGTAGPLKQAGQQTVCLYTHLSRLAGEMTLRASPGVQDVTLLYWPTTWCEYHVA